MANLIHINKAHFVKVTDMENKFVAAVTISECLIHTAYDHQLALCPSSWHTNRNCQLSTKWQQTANFSPLSPNLWIFSECRHHKFTDQKKMFSFLSSAFHWFQTTTWCCCMNLFSFQCILISWPMSPSLWMSARKNIIAIGHSKSYQTLSTSNLQNYLRLVDTFFFKGRYVLLTYLAKTCIGWLYLANANTIKRRLKFIIGDAREKIFSWQQHITP